MPCSIMVDHKIRNINNINQIENQKILMKEKISEPNSTYLKKLSRITTEEKTLIHSIFKL